jgi:DNA polymerase-1
MRHAIYGAHASTASVAILVKEAAFDSDKIKKAYIEDLGANPEGFLAYSLWYNNNNKCPAGLAKDYLKTVLHSVKALGIKQILIADSKYFEYLTNLRKAASNYIGYEVKSKIADYEDEFSVFYVPNYQAAKYNPTTAQEITTALDYFKRFLSGSYIEPGKNIIHSAAYPMTLQDIKSSLEWLLTKPKLTVDIEGLSLKFWKCGVATISFAWDKHNFISFPVDRGTFGNNVNNVLTKPFGWYVKDLLRIFFEDYKGTLIPHSGNFDFKVLTYELWMEDLQDYRGMIQGIQIMTKNFEDTKLITYLATNNAVENVLGLKPLSAPYMGSYAENVKDTSIIPLDKLLEYNGKDCLATWYVHDKYYPTMVADNQQTIYEELFKPSLITLLQTELVGMPILPDAVALARRTLENLRDAYNQVLTNSTIMKEFQLDVKARKCKEYTAAAKKKVFDMADPRIDRLVFNPNSNQQVGDLLYTYLGLPILDLTKEKEPAVGSKTLLKLLNHTTNPRYLEIIQALVDLSQVEKILNSFIPAFENNSVQMPDGSWRLYGNFNLGGTVSGRLSSSDPNLQNLPSHSIWAKLIKECFGCISDWLFGGADFNSLEDMVSALTTRDPNKMKVYTGHTIYEITINGTCHHIRDDAIIIFDGQTYAGGEFYEWFSSNSTL